MGRSQRRNDDSPALELKPWHWFLLAAAVPIVHCASRLNLDLWHDEIYTIESFVRRGPAFIVSDYHLPNNHVLFSLLEWPFYCLSDSNFVLRLPSFLCMVGTLIVLFRLAFRLAGLPCAVLSTAMLGLNQMYLNFAIQVRGYSLSMFLAVCLASLAVPPSAELNWRRLIAIPLVGAAFLYVLPTNGLFFAPIAAFAVGLAMARRSGVKSTVCEVAAWTAAVVIAIVCYLPIVEQIRSASATSSPSSWSYLPVIAVNFFRPATHDLIWLAPLFLLGLSAWAWPRSTRLRQRIMPLLCTSVVVGAFLLTGLLRISPFERVYCPLLVFLALAGGWLLAELTDVARRRLAPMAAPEVATVVSLAAISLAIWPQLWTYPQRLEERRNEYNAKYPWPEFDGWPIADGYYCYYAANYGPSAIVNYLLDQNIEASTYRICWTDADHLNLSYYFSMAGLPQVYRSPEKGRRMQLFAVTPQPPPWNRLAKECELPEQVTDAFRPIGDFGYYRLYRLNLHESERTKPPE